VAYLLHQTTQPSAYGQSLGFLPTSHGTLTGHPPCTYLLIHDVPRGVSKALNPSVIRERGIPQRGVTPGDIYAHLNNWRHAHVPSSVFHATTEETITPWRTLQHS
jgi:hypothetical protein